MASALYPAVLAGAGSAAPSLEAFAARLASIPGYDEQLEYVATFRPAQVGSRHTGELGRCSADATRWLAGGLGGL